MPQVIITHRNTKVSDEFQIKPALVGLATDVARILTEPDAPLAAIDVEIILREAGRFDHNVPDFGVTVIARNTTRRTKNKSSLTQRIANAVNRRMKFSGKIFQPECWYVWLQLPEACFLQCSERMFPQQRKLRRSKTKK